MSTRVYSEVYRIVSKLTGEISVMEEHDEMKDVLQGRITKLMKVGNSLKTTSKKASFMKECSELFYREHFEEVLDGKNNLVGFNNGVYDLELAQFRDGDPDDLVSLSTGIDYIEEADSTYRKEIMDFMDRILPTKETRDFVLLLFSSFLHGAIKDEKFHIWVGNGCHAKDTLIRMYNGELKKIQDIGVGEQLMGDDSTPRNVERLWRGNSKMYDIIPSKGEKFTVTGNHKLALKVSKQGGLKTAKESDKFILYYKINNVKKSKHFNTEEDAITFAKENLDSDIKYRVNKYIGKHQLLWQEIVSDSEEDGMIIKNCKKTFITMEELELYRTTQMNDKVLKYEDTVIVTVDNILKHHLNLERYKLFSVGIEYDNKEVPIDPYMLGYWLGDGHSKDSAITTMDEEVVEYFDEKAGNYNCRLNKAVKLNNKASTYRLQSLNTNENKTRGKLNTNKFMNALRELDVFGNKHIPELYKINDRQNRLELLAGIIDSDGHLTKNTSGSNNFEITFKSKALLEDVVELANSLGFAAYCSEITKTCQVEGFSGTYYRTQIHGIGIDTIPTKLQRKQAEPYDKLRNPCYVGFKIQQVDDDDYYGVQVDQNHMYVMGKNYMATNNSNGKSLLVSLFQKCFGDYCGQFNVTMLTQKRVKSNDTNSELVQAKGKRFCVLQEPSENEKINVGIMKELTGGDKVQGRGLYKDPITFKPQFKMVLTCNHLPGVMADDGGTWRRLRVLRFPSKFCENPDPNNSLEFKADTSLSEKFDDWKETFMKILLEYYAIYAKNGIVEPQDVILETNEYKRNNDQYAGFLDTLVEKSTKKTDIIDVDELYDLFKNWWSNTNASIRCPVKTTFKLNCNKHLGKDVRKGSSWHWNYWKYCDMDKKADDEDDM
jgi:P4 family phage/plasmid primase-like protien